MAVTVMAIGETGVGKSENGNAFLQNKNAFEANSRPQACTFKTSAKRSKINGIMRYYIDTQGLASTDNLNAQYVQQMVEFLKNWDRGVNAIFIILNIQNPRFDSGIQKMLKFVNEFFNNSNFWNQTGVIFTRCFDGHFNRRETEDKYHKIILNFIKKLPGCRKLNPQLLLFFVDSVKWDTSPSTKHEYLRIFEFAHKFSPLKTKNVIPACTEYWKREEQITYRNQVDVKHSKDGYIETITYYYEDRKRYKITGFNGDVIYTEPKIINSYQETETIDRTPPPPRVIHEYSSDDDFCNIF